MLDPACGSGNFLYVALKALKDIEHRANLDAEALGLSRGFPRTGPECARGIELNPYAAELARVSVWIGEIQWMRRNGFDAAKNPILRPLDTIECRDAVLNADGTRADWPAADVVIGNPPFLGAAKHLRELGESYTTDLRIAYRGMVPESADLVCYWFAQCLASDGRLQSAGLVARQAERMKCFHGSATTSPRDNHEMIEVAPIGSEADGTEGGGRITKAQLISVIRQRLDHLVGEIATALKTLGFTGPVGRQVVLTGGGAELKGVADYVQGVLGRAVRVGRPRGLSGLPDAHAGPAFATLAGLAQFAASEQLDLRQIMPTQQAVHRAASGKLFGRLIAAIRTGY